jgi:hypothetical protein
MMIEACKQPMPKIAAGPKSIPSKVTMMTHAMLWQQNHRERAYELYKSGGCDPVRDEQDSLRAEQEAFIGSVRAVAIFILGSLSGLVADQRSVFGRGVSLCESFRHCLSHLFLSLFRFTSTVPV